MQLEIQRCTSLLKNTCLNTFVKIKHCTVFIQEKLSSVATQKVYAYMTNKYVAQKPNASIVVLFPHLILVNTGQ